MKAFLPDFERAKSVNGLRVPASVALLMDVLEALLLIGACGRQSSMLSAGDEAWRSISENSPSTKEAASADPRNAPNSSCITCLERLFVSMQTM